MWPFGGKPRLGEFSRGEIGGLGGPCGRRMVHYSRSVQIRLDQGAKRELGRGVQTCISIHTRFELGSRQERFARPKQAWRAYKKLPTGRYVILVEAGLSAGPNILGKRHLSTRWSRDYPSRPRAPQRIMISDRSTVVLVWADVQG